MWHASGNAGKRSSSLALARQVLSGVGDRHLGEWVEDGNRSIVHLRRRLSRLEQEAFGIAEVVDVRGTDEEQRRLRRVLMEAPQLRAYLPL